MSRGEADSMVLSLGKMDVVDVVLLYRVLVFELSKAATAVACPPVSVKRTYCLLARVRLVKAVEAALVKAGRSDVLHRAVWDPGHLSD